MIDGALMLDILLKKGSVMGYDPDSMSFRFTVGAEMHRFTEGDTSFDNRSFFGLLNITPTVADPSAPEKRNMWRQPVQLGAVLHQDLLTDESAWGFILNYQPVVGVIGKWFELRDKIRGVGLRLEGLAKKKELVNPATDNDAPGAYHDKEDSRLLQGTAFERLEDGEDGELVAMPKSVSASALRVDPFIGLNLADGSALSSVDQLSDAYLRYGITARAAFFHRRVILGYSLTCNTGIDGGQSHVLHSAFVDYLPRPQGSVSPLAIRAAWTSGEAGPSFTDHEIFTVGLALKL
jgi:hypothetical protein